MGNLNEKMCKNANINTSYYSNIKIMILYYKLKIFNSIFIYLSKKDNNAFIKYRKY
jgi:hypothetical protein